MKKIIFFGTYISWICQKHQLKLVDKLIREKTSKYVTYSNVHVVVTCKKDKRFRESINNAFIASPDGKPLKVVGRLKGAKCIEKCSGPDMMKQIIEMGLDKGYTHYFFGSTEDTLKKLNVKLKKLYPNIIIVGSYSPPFRQLTNKEDEQIVNKINRLSPDCIWVGLGAPKQELWMYNHRNVFKKGVMFGVGAAFDFHAGTLKRAPLWMQKSGLEWFYRLSKEPGRLWKRYFVTNTLFLWYLIRYGVNIVDDSSIGNIGKSTYGNYNSYCSKNYDNER